LSEFLESPPFIDMGKIANMEGISCETLIYRLDKLFRGVCSHALDVVNMKIGGPELIVQVDEFNLGTISQPRWYFACYCKDQKKALVRPIEDRYEATLIPLIENHVVRGSIIHSDQWKGYAALTEYGWTHLVAKKQFVDPESGAHTQEVKSFWNQIKRRVEFYHFEYNGNDGTEGRIVEAMYKFNFGSNSFKSFQEKFETFIEHIRAKYTKSTTSASA
jgi:hypothetical protein